MKEALRLELEELEERIAPSTSLGQRGYEGQPGNQGNGLGGYEGQPAIRVAETRVSRQGRHRAALPPRSVKSVTALS